MNETVICRKCGQTMYLERFQHYGEVCFTYICLCGEAWDEQIEANRKEMEELRKEQECRKKKKQSSRNESLSI